jgi:hypothetical protein
VDTPSEEEICDLCAAMWSDLYSGDLTEEARAATVYERHSTITEELYLAVWGRLDSKFRAAWKAYVAQERALQRSCFRDTDRQGARLPERYR